MTDRQTGVGSGGCLFQLNIQNNLCPRSLHISDAAVVWHDLPKKNPPRKKCMEGAGIKSLLF